MWDFISRNWVFILAVAAMMLMHFGMHRSAHGGNGGRGGHGGGCGAHGNAGAESNSRPDRAHTAHDKASTTPPSTFDAGISPDGRGTQPR